jgi:hypothetical protein
MRLEIPPYECGKGWSPLINKAVEGIQKEVSTWPDTQDFYITQIKEKFGGLRIYLSAYNDRLDAIVRAACEEARKTCELCGEPGVLGEEGRWLQTLCEKCRKEKA